MARKRDLKPEYFDDKTMGELGSHVGTVYQAMWSIADDGGVCKADPGSVLAVFADRWPEYTTSSVTKCIQRLSDSRRVTLYSVGDRLYAEINSWERHQKPNNPSKFRHPRGGQRVTVLSEFLGQKSFLLSEPPVLREPHPPDTSNQMPVASSPIPEAKAAADSVSLTYLQRCVIALNMGLQENPRVPHPREVPSSTQVALVTWEEDGIPVELVERIIGERARNYVPAGQNLQPHSLKYFDGAVREAWEKARAVAPAPVSGSAMRRLA